MHELVQDSIEALRRVLGQDILSSALYWFTPRRQEIVSTKTEKLLTGLKATKQIHLKFFKNK